MQNEFTFVLHTLTGINASVSACVPVSGGSINHVFKILYGKDYYLLKCNRSRLYPDMFEKEIIGLHTLHQTNLFRVPTPIGHLNTESFSYLCMEFIESGRQSENFFSDFGQRLAQLHQHTQSHFGFESDNYIGSLRQSNTLTSNFHEFFFTNRLHLLSKKAVEMKLMPYALAEQIENVWKNFESIFSHRKPALIHGDLWNGNYLVDTSGIPCLIDPACYYGIGESDLAMSKLFGGFDESFYRAYHEVIPHTSESECMKDLMSLYPLLVHVILFGRSYLSAIEQIVSKYE